MRKVKVTISNDGAKILVDAEGFAGDACKRTTKSLLDQLGVVTSSDDKSDLYLTETEGEFEVL